MLNSFKDEFSKFAAKNWYVIDSETNGCYLHHDPKNSLTKSIESSHYDHSDAYNLVTGNNAFTRTIAATGDNPIQKNQPFTVATRVVFKNCAPFKNCGTEVNNTFVDEENFINIAMPMHNLIEYSDNYSDTSGSLWGFERDGITGMIMLLHLNIKQALLLILMQMEQEIE